MTTSFSDDHLTRKQQKHFPFLLVILQEGSKSVARPQELKREREGDGVDNDEIGSND